jgi:hypothetical protein
MNIVLTNPLANITPLEADERLILDANGSPRRAWYDRYGIFDVPPHNIPAGHWLAVRLQKDPTLDVMDLGAGDKFPESYQTYTWEQMQAYVKANPAITGAIPIRTAGELRYQFDALSPVHETHGADPEVFLTDPSGEMVPAFSLAELAGGKRIETSKSSWTDHGQGHDINATVYNDGCAVEFSIPAGSCWAYGVDSIRAGLKSTYDTVAQPHGLSMDWRDVLPIPKGFFSPTYKDELVLGCKPSFNAYGDQPDLPEGHRFPLRTTGFHLHLGGRKLKNLPSSTYDNIVSTMDLLVALPMTALVGHLEDRRRRIFYGRAGEYRTPKYGLEYRVLSPAVMRAPVLVHLAMELLRRAAAVGVNFAATSLYSGDFQIVRDIINTSNFEAAHAFIKQNKLLYEGFLTSVFDPNEASMVLAFLTEPGLFKSWIDLSNPVLAWGLDLPKKASAGGFISIDANNNAYYSAWGNHSGWPCVTVGGLAGIYNRGSVDISSNLLAAFERGCIGLGLKRPEWVRRKAEREALASKATAAAAGPKRRAVATRKVATRSRVSK